MILDISRHKFYEALIMLLIITTITVAGAFALGDELATATIATTSPIAESIMGWCVNHPTLTALALIPIFINISLSLARATVRTSLYPNSSLAAISLIALAVMGTAITASYPIAILTTLFTAQCLARLLYCFGPNKRLNKLFTAMLAAGVLPLLDGAMASISIIIFIFITLQRGTARESIIALGGLLLPTFVCSYIYWLTGESFIDTSLNIWHAATNLGDITELVDYITLPRLILLGYILFMYLITSFYYLGGQTSFNNLARAAWPMLHIVSISSVAITIFIPSAAQSLLCCATISVATMLPLMHQRIGDMWSAVSYIAFICLSIYSLWG